MIFNKRLAVLPFVARALGNPVEARAVYDFTIYAYGSEDIGGFPIVSINDTAYITSYPLENMNETLPGAANITFNAYDRRGNLTASIEGEGQSLLFVPTTSGSVGFTNTTDDDTIITTGFGFYGQVVFLQEGTTMETEWYAVPTDDINVWALSWNDEADGSPVALRYVSPT